MLNDMEKQPKDTDFSKEPKDFGHYNKMNSIVYDKTIVRVELTDRENERRCRCWPTTLYSWALVLLSFIFLVSSVGTVIAWGTELLDEKIIENMVLRNNTAKYELWRKTPIRPLMKIYIFNYTNTGEFMTGMEKPRVEEVGPFVYREIMERVNVRFNSNGTVSYQERRNFEFVPELSSGSLDDYVVVPNMALLAASARLRDIPYILQYWVSFGFITMDYQPFVRVKVRGFIWGYEDPLLNLANANPLLNLPIKKIGLMVLRNGTNPDKMTVYTGVGNISRLGVMDRFKGHDRNDVWDTDHCNRIDGTDGSMFPPHWVGEKETLHIYMPLMCRKFPLVFKEHLEIYGGVPAMRFHAPRDVFDHASTNEKNACFCSDPQTCPPAGVFNVAPCTFGLPLVISFPHFYLGDPVLREGIEGLHPRKDIHDTFMDLHPKYGFPLAGMSRLQVNYMVRKSKIANLEAFTERQILPIAWFDAGLVDLPDDMLSLLHHVTFTRQKIEVGILCTAIITGFILAVILLRCVYRNCQSQRARRVADVYMSQIIMAAASTSEKGDKMALDLDI